MPSFDSSPQKERLVVWVTSLRFPTSNHDLVGRHKFSCKPFYRNPSKKSTGLSRLHHPYHSQTWMIARQRNCTRDWSTTKDKNIRISLFDASRSEISRNHLRKSRAAAHGMNLQTGIQQPALMGTARYSLKSRKSPKIKPTTWSTLKNWSISENQKRSTPLPS